MGRLGKLCTVLVLVGGSAATVLAQAAPAQASPDTVAGCQQNRPLICVFDGTGGAGDTAGKGPDINGVWHGQPDMRTMPIVNTNRTNFNDRADSYMNNTSLTWCWYEDINYHGAVHQMPPSGPFVIDLPASQRNKMSSFQPCDS